ncbi:Transcription elongation factor TFIIS [Ananas comosus]|uniref:Transcription elongation factor TFIIS n=1 Tax=Ananas comosus TaxID=4615 RepID=A0A199W485_ANACO|nr:Transcription elongation factor TFIIS [Ananas comosus]
MSMEKELVETFEAAKKAADAAADAGAGGGGGSPEAERCVDALKRLRKMRVTTEVLVATQVGKRLRYLTKHPHSGIQSIASDLLAIWKNIVIEETSSSKKNGISENKKPVKVEIKSETAMKVDKSATSSIKVESTPASATPKAEKRDSDLSSSKSESTKNERVFKEENKASVSKKPSSLPSGPPKLSSLIKSNDPARDKIRELLAEAFTKVSGETAKDDRDEVRYILDEVDACDPFRIAVTVESALFEKLGKSTGTHKQKYRSIMFNLRAENNTDFRRRVLLGKVKPERLVDLTPEEMASDARKMANKQIKEKALFECERAGAPKATTRPV